MMKTMGRKKTSHSNGTSPPSSRRRRAPLLEGNQAFVRAMADALRDILEDERRHVAAA
jgi:hypothetical protein